MQASILVVDDDVLHRELVRAALSDMCEVHEANDAEAALCLLAGRSIDLVVLDVVMPGETGIDACRKIKALTGRRVPVLLVTALSDREHRLAGLSSGADDFLTKPFDRTELRLRVDLFLRLRKQERQIEEQLLELQRLDALKDDLASLLVHDLKHPLTGVFAWLAIAKESAAPETAAELDNALAAATRVRDAINDLLQIRALEQGHLTAARDVVNVTEAVNAAIGAVDGAARERGITVQVLAHDLMVRADAPLLRRAVENLLANAIRHSPPSGLVEIAVTAREGGVRIEVADRGPGVPDERKEMVFTKFGMLDPGAMRTRRGFGLGLYLVQLVAEAHGGRASVCDRPGGGALFEVFLPSHQ